MSTSRREFLRNAGALIVSFSAASLAGSFTFAQGPFDTHPSHIDPTKLDSWIAVDADGMVTAYTGKCDFGQGMSHGRANTCGSIDSTVLQPPIRVKHEELIAIARARSCRDTQESIATVAQEPGTVTRRGFKSRVKWGLQAPGTSSLCRTTTPLSSRHSPLSSRFPITRIM